MRSVTFHFKLGVGGMEWHLTPTHRLHRPGFSYQRFHSSIFLSVYCHSIFAPQILVFILALISSLDQNWAYLSAFLRNILYSFGSLCFHTYFQELTASSEIPTLDLSLCLWLNLKHDDLDHLATKAGSKLGLFLAKHCCQTMVTNINREYNLRIFTLN